MEKHWILKLINKNAYDYDKIVVDQFVYPQKYYDHLKNSKYIVKNISFTTKAEDKCLSVACSSVISRYIFLNEIEKMGKKYGEKILLGAGNDVDELAKKLKDKYGNNELKKMVKLNFKNTEKIQ